MAEVDVSDEVLCSAGEELVWGCEAPRDAMDIGVLVGGGTGDSRMGRAFKGAVENEVIKRVGGPAAGACELVQGDVGLESGRVVQREGMAHHKAEDSEGGVPQVAWHMVPRVGVLVGGNGCCPKRVVGADT